MTTCIALLRGINVGGHHRLRMPDLQRLCTGLGLRDVRTYIQSGNVVFTARGEDLDETARAIEQQLVEQFDIVTPVIARTAEEFEPVVEGNPFAAQANADPTRVHVAFLSAEPADPATLTFAAKRFAPERIEAADRTRYLLLPDGIGRSRLVTELMARPSGVQITVRNWRTVMRLHAMTAFVPH